MTTIRERFAAFAFLLAFLQQSLGRSDVRIGDDLYMRRWRLVNWRWFGLRLHNIVRSDQDRELHDHPFDFVSVVLSGGYLEHTADGERRFYGPGSILFRRAEKLHRLELLDDRPTWTFVVRGPIRRHWGFQTPTGWIHWRKFTGSTGASS